MRFRYYKYSAAKGVEKLKTRTAIALTAIGLIVGGGGGVASLVLSTAHAAAVTQVVSGDTASGENQPGWLFNRDSSTSTPYEFNTDAASIGTGSLYVKPITNTHNGNNDKFVAENFLATNVSDVSSISYDYMQSGTTNSTSYKQFYMNVYANFGDSSQTKFYDCRYDYVPATGSESGWNTATFSPDSTPSAVIQSGTSPHSCPALLSDMTGGYVRAFALNVGDTSANDQGLAGYLDNVVVATTADTTTYDFEPLGAPTLLTPANNSVVNGATLLSDWTDVPGADYYVYQSFNDAGLTSLRYQHNYTTSEKTATNVPDATFWWRVKAVNSIGQSSAWSSAWKVTVDNEAPVVAITNPNDGGTVYGTVDVRGSVNDAHPDHYYAVVKDQNGHVVAGPGVVYDTSSFTDQHLFSWNTTSLPDGQYAVDLEARDAAGNKDAGSVATITVTVNNTPDNKDQCKNDGWKNFTNPTFKNQGQCISYVNHNDGVGQDDNHAHNR